MDDSAPVWRIRAGFREYVAMTQLGGGRGPAFRGRPQSDIYTVLLAIATAFVLAGTVYVSAQLVRVFGSLTPPTGG